MRKIVALADTHGADAVTSAMDDAMKLHVVGADYIANILECRACKLPELGPLYLTRRSDLIDLKIKGLTSLGADLLFQIISQRYERGSIIITSNRAFNHWPGIFNNDSMLTSAILDRLLHHAETMVIEGTAVS